MEKRLICLVCVLTIIFGYSGVTFAQTWEVAYQETFSSATYPDYFQNIDSFYYSNCNIGTYGSSGNATDLCVQNSGDNYSISFGLELSSDYEYRIIWNVKTNTNPGSGNVKQFQYFLSGTFGAFEQAVSSIFDVPYVAFIQSPGVDIVSDVFQGADGIRYLEVGPMNASAGPAIQARFDDFRLERRLLPTSSANLASLVYLRGDCGAGGAVKFELNGDPNLYTYYWEHGPTELCLSGLAPGTYTFVVRDFYGCEERYEIEIIQIESCKLILDIEELEGECKNKITIAILNNNTGLLYDTSSFTIEWADDPLAGFTRIVDVVDYDVTYQYTVTAIGGDGEICCREEGSFTIEGDREADCGEEPDEPPFCPRIVVNEMNGRRNDTLPQYIELLVVCDGNCGGKFDIRGFIIDDNNGDLIAGNSLVSSSNSSVIGIDQGYLVFPYEDTWKEVPNGSLIVIYDDRFGTSGIIPAEDPTDINQDSVYIIAASNSEYLYGGTGIWNSLAQKMEYSGNLSLPSWDLIEISSNADAVQTRKSNTAISHGISLGESIYSNDSIAFEMHLGSGNPLNSNCQLIQNDFQNPESYSCNSINIPSPGLANSTANEDYIRGLRDCNNCESCDPLPLLGNPGSNFAQNYLKVFPNPFSKNFSLMYKSSSGGTFGIEIFSSDSKRIYSLKFNSDQLYEVKPITALSNLPSGFYFLRFTFPDGELMQEKIIRIQD